MLPLGFRRKGPTLQVYAERQIEDLGTFGVFWYRRPTGHTKTGARHRGETDWITQWSFVYRVDAGGAWAIGRAVSGFATRADAIAKATDFTKGGR